MEQVLPATEDTPLAITLGASDPEGDPLTYAVISPPSHGTLTGVAPALVYTPARNYEGPDAFTFTVSDGVSVSPPATIQLAVAPVNDLPVPQTPQVSTDEDVAVTFELAAFDADGDALVFGIRTAPLHGSVTLSGPRAVYTPTRDFHGVDGFTFVASDKVAHAAAKVTIAVAAMNDAPYARPDSAFTVVGRPVIIPILSNDEDVDGDALTYDVASAPEHGITSVEPDGKLRYLPDAQFEGTDVFEYAVADSEGATAIATVMVVVARSGTLVRTVPIGGNGNAEVNGLALLPDGSAIVAGTFRSTAMFGTTSLTSAGNEDVFVGRFSAEGEVLWVKRAGGPGWDQTWSFAALPDGSVLIGGKYERDARFGDGEPGETLLPSPGEQTCDAFVARYMSDGALAWVNAFGGPYGTPWGDAVTALAPLVDGSGFMLGGFVEHGATLASGEPNATHFDGTRNLLARYTVDGRLVWARWLGGGPYDMITHLANGIDGTVYVTGVFGAVTGAATFGAGEPFETVLVADGPQTGSDVFLARYEPGGALVWARRAGGDGDDQAWGIELSGDGAHLALAGAFGAGVAPSSITFGAGESAALSLTSAGRYDAFVVGYDLDGSPVWARRAGSPRDDGAHWLLPLPDGALVVGGSASYGATFGEGTPDETVLSQDSTFIARYTDTGTFTWVTPSPLCVRGAVTADGALVLACAASAEPGAPLTMSTFVP